jgi:glycosyltransferase involved in cell wall biosynthesis
MKSPAYGGKDKMKTICLVSGSSPKFLGGISLYQRNLIEYAKEKKLDFQFSWVYPGKENKRYSFKGVNCIEVKSLKYPFVKEFDFARKAKKIIEKEHFDLINTHANWGYCLRRYKKKFNQRIIHTYHGVTVPYIKIQLKKFGVLKRTLMSPLILSSYLLEKTPMKKANQIICVSEKVKRDLERTYWKREGMGVLRTGVDLKQFKEIKSEQARKDLKLERKTVYGLYSGRGGYWNKGLDRAVSIGKEIYAENKNFRLIVIGSDKAKCAEYLKEDFIIYRGLIGREQLSKYYSACDFFFSLSRYEGGAPTLVVGEAMASGCFIVFSKDSEQEIIGNEKEGLIIDSFGKESAERILSILGNKKKLNNIKEGARKRIKEFDLNSWGKKYFKVFEKL